MRSDNVLGLKPLNHPQQHDELELYQKPGINAYLINYSMEEIYQL